MYETPGHAPSHVVLHQPERGLLLSGDHLLGRVSLFYDYGWSPDPAGEFLRSLDVVDALDVQLVLAGHGRPVRDARALAAANRREVNRQLDVVRAEIASAPKTPFEIVPALVGPEASGGMAVSWGLSEALCYLDHLELQGEATRSNDGEHDVWGGRLGILPVVALQPESRTVASRGPQGCNERRSEGGVAARAVDSPVRVLPQSRPWCSATSNQDCRLDRRLGPRPRVRGAQRRQDRARCGRAVERVEVDPGRASRQEIGALESRVGDSELCDRFRVVGAPVELALELGRDRRAAHAGDRLDLAARS